MSEYAYQITSKSVRKRALTEIVSIENEKLNEKWSQKIIKLKQCDLFDHFINLNGIPKREFLKKIISINYTFGAKPPAAYDTMGVLLNLLESQTDRFKLIDTMHNIRKLTVMSDHRKDILKWFGECSPKNKLTFINGLESCVSSTSITLVEEATIFIAHLAYELEEEFGKFTRGLSIVLLNSVSGRVLSMNEYLISYRAAYEHYLNQKILFSKHLQFRFPRYMQPASGVDHMSISCALYALTFLLQFTLHPDLVMFFAKHILLMNEMTRYYALKILQLMVEQMVHQIKENIEIWDEVPRTVYYELVRIYNEKNVEIRKILKKTLEMVRSVSKTKLPNVEEFALRQQEDQEKIKKIMTHVSSEDHPGSKKDHTLNFKKWKSVSKHVGMCSILARKQSDSLQIKNPRHSHILPPIDTHSLLESPDTNKQKSSRNTKSLLSVPMSLIKKNS